MVYDPFDWQTGEAGGTPITAERLDAMEQGIGDVSQQVEGRLSDESLNSTYLPLAGLRKPLDIWGAYTGPTTYTALIAEIDSALGTAVEKQQFGDSSGVTPRPLYAYTAGSETGKRVLINAGTHGGEGTGAMYAWQWFKAFVTSADPVMVALRARVRVTYVPFLNASQYLGTRNNSATSPVNINRNFPMNWDITPNDVNNPKGTAPLSEPEAAGLKDLIDEMDIETILDVHNTNAGYPTDINIGSVGAYLNANRNIELAALNYATDFFGGDGFTFAQYPDLVSPTLVAWGAKYLRWNKGKRNGSAFVIEVEPGTGGSTGGSSGVAPSITASAARAVCTSINLWLIEWLQNGQLEQPPIPRGSYGRAKFGMNAELTIAEGGRKLGADWAPILFNSGFDYLPVPIRFPGNYLISYDICLRTSEATSATVSTAISFGQMPPTGDSPRIGGGSATDVVIPASFKDVVISRSAVVPVDSLAALDTNFFIAQIWAKINTGSNVRLFADFAGFSLSVIPSPSYPGWDDYFPAQLG